MTLKELMGGLEGIFDPEITYLGTYDLSIQYFLEASIIKNRKNLVAEYIYNSYPKVFKDALKYLFTKDEISTLTVSSIESKHGRELIINPSLLIIWIFKGSLRINLSYDLINDKDELIKEAKKALIDMDKRANDILYGRKNISEDKLLYDYFKDEEKIYRKKTQIIIPREALEQLDIRKFPKANYLNYVKPTVSNDKPIILNSEKHFCVNILQIINNLEKAIPVIYKEFAKPLDLQELEKLVDFDKLCLYVVSRYMVYLSEPAKESGIICYAAVVLDKYYKAISELQMKQNYKFHVKIPDGVLSVDNVKHYTTKGFMQQFESIIRQYPDEELELYTKIEPDKDVDYRNFENIKKEIKRLKDKKEAAALLANWEFIPNGSFELGKKDNVKNLLSEKDEPSIKKNYERKEYADLSNILEKTNYQFVVYGKDRFAGYKGFLYENGYIIFERGTEVDGVLVRVVDNATYVMQLDNFREMTKVTKPDIMAYIKSGECNVKRIYHSLNWKSKILAVANAEPYYNPSLYTDGVVGEIKRLISLGELIEENSEEQKLNLSNN